MSDLEGLKVSFVAGTLGQGGAERQLFYIVQALAASGAIPRVLCLTRGEFWEDPIRELGVPVTWVGERESRLARLRAIVAAARANRPDVVQSTHFYTNLYTVGAARMLGVREVGAIRSNLIWEVENVGALGRLSLRAPRLMAANSRAAIANAVAMGKRAERLHFLPNVVDTNRFAPPDSRPHGRVRLLGVGRRGLEKRFDRFLSVLAAVRQRTKQPVTGVLVTTGADGGALEAQAARMGLTDAVEFRESVADMAPVYRCMDVFLLTSDWEGTPNVVLEAMSSGTPVVSTRVGGVPDLVRHGDTGYLADVGDDDALVASVLALVENDDARLSMGRRASAYIDEHHSVDRLPAILDAFYGTVMA